jgi:hypothetical protein
MFVVFGLLYVKSKRWSPWGKRPPRRWYRSYWYRAMVLFKLAAEGVLM